MCAQSGWSFDGEYRRDSDWFEVISIGGQITFSVISEFAVNIYVILPDCNTIQYLYTGTVGPCQSGIIEFSTDPGEVYWLQVRPTVSSGPDHPFEFDYIMDVCGIVGPIPGQKKSWGSVKAIYK